MLSHGQRQSRINAEYNPASNDMIFMAGYMLPPFYDPNAPILGHRLAAFHGPSFGAMGRGVITYFPLINLNKAYSYSGLVLGLSGVRQIELVWFPLGSFYQGTNLYHLLSYASVHRPTLPNQESESGPQLKLGKVEV